MKTKYIYCALIAVCLNAFGQESEAPLPNSILKLNPIELAFSTFMIELEDFNKQGTKSTSFGIGATYSDRENYENEKVSGIKGEIIHRIYISPLAQRTSKKGRDYMLGIYGGLFIRGGYEQLEHDFYNYNTSDMDVNTRRGAWIFPGAMIGVARTFWDKLLVDVYLGAGIRAINVTHSNPNYNDNNYYYYYYHISPLDYGGVAPNMGIKVGLWL